MYAAVCSKASCFAESSLETVQTDPPALTLHAASRRVVGLASLAAETYSGAKSISHRCCTTVRHGTHPLHVNDMHDRCADHEECLGDGVFLQEASDRRASSHFRYRPAMLRIGDASMAEVRVVKYFSADRQGTDSRSNSSQSQF